MTIVAGKATGTVSGFPPGTAVTVGGQPHTADGMGIVSLSLLPLALVVRASAPGRPAHASRPKRVVLYAGRS